MSRPRIILASSSPRRRLLLEEAGIEFDIIAPHPDTETGHLPGESPDKLVARLARLKAADVARRVTRGLVVGCDTVAECGGRILGKPVDRRDAAEMLRWLRGRVHHVYSGLCLWSRPDDRVLCRTAITKLKMADVPDDELHPYLDSGLWQGKAGAFGYQDRNDWLQIVAGSESNVVGLPLELFEEMCASFSRGA